MRVVVFGAGAIGGVIAARLAAAGQEVGLLARGEKLAALKAEGLRLTDRDGTIAVRPHLSDDPAAFGQPDLLVVALKAPALAGALPQLAALVGPHTTVLPAMNGIPWWYNGSAPVRALDPDGAILAALPTDRVVGCVVYLAAHMAGPAEVVHASGNRLILGEPDGGETPRLAAAADLLTAAGFAARTTGAIRQAVWGKLLGNLSYNTVGALTGTSIAGTGDDPGLLAIVRRMMEEAQATARANGLDPAVDIDARIAEARTLGDFKSSMLQDIEAGRPIELAALLGAVIELADAAGQPAATLRTVHDLLAHKVGASGGRVSDI